MGALMPLKGTGSWLSYYLLWFPRHCLFKGIYSFCLATLVNFLANAVKFTSDKAKTETYRALYVGLKRFHR
jgi:hypothetical protein